MSSTDTTAWARATAMFFGAGSRPVTEAPRRASGSERTPPPQPISTTERPASESSALGSRAKALHAAPGRELEYVMQFAAADGFNLVLRDIVARAPGCPDELQGPRVFGAFGVDDPVTPEAATMW